MKNPESQVKSQDLSEYFRVNGKEHSWHWLPSTHYEH